MDAELLKSLSAIGFTDYEARVYLALLQENPTTGYQLSKLAGIPRSMVYEALGRLSVRGAVLKTGTQRATLYRPVSPETLLDRYIQEQQSHVRLLKDGLERLFRPEDEGRLWSIQGRAAVVSYSEQLISAAEIELMLVMPDDYLNDLREQISSACERSVGVSALLTGSGDLGCGESIYHPPIESEMQELSGMLVVVSDAKECLIAGAETEPGATITTNRNLVYITRQFVWMEIFAQRLYTHIGSDFTAGMTPEDRHMLENFAKG